MGLSIVRIKLDGDVGKRKGHFHIVGLQRTVFCQEYTLNVGVLTSIGLRKFIFVLIGPVLSTKLL